MQENRLKRAEIKVIGQVQGVFFRQSVKTEAERLGLGGWVRNEEDGSVKIVVEGAEESLQKLVEWARLGTEWARVDEVKVEWQDARGKLNRFEIKQ